MKTTPDPMGWHIQILDTEWVSWGYDSTGPLHIEPAIRHIAGHKIEFKLPDLSDRGLQTKEFARQKAVGWRFKSNCLIHDTHWKLADNSEEAINAAIEWAKKQRDTEKWLLWAQDVRTLEESGSLIQDILSNA